jgi:Zn finger protein HypA/HybF involved in hydrogenase expression
MTLYKCKYCTHEEDYQRHPSECPICGQSSLMVIDSKLKILFKEEERHKC